HSSWNNTQMFGAGSSDLAPGAKNAVEVCLGITASDRVALIADEASASVAANLADALDAVGARWDGVLIENEATRPITRAPQAVLDALGRADAGILCVQPREGELAARMEIVGLVEQRAIRYAHMVGVTPTIMRQGMRADYRLVDALSQRLLGRMREARRLDVRTEAGTPFGATFDRARSRGEAHGRITPRYWPSLPPAAAC